MSRIDDLIQEVCPDGVEHVELRSTGTWYGGGTPSKSKLEYWTGGSVPWISPKDMGGRIVDSSIDMITEAAVAGSAAKLVPPTSIAMVVRSSILDHTFPTAIVPVAVALNQDMKAVVPHEGIMVEYLAHVLSSRGQDILRKASKSGGSVTSINSPQLLNYRIPMPPLEVQREIVRVLDKFTQLEAELEAELEARRRQYEHYRDEALSFGDAVRSVPLGDVIHSLRTGLNPRQNFKLNSPGAANQYITVRELAGFKIIPTHKTDLVDDEGLARIQARSRLQVGDVLFSGTGTIGRTALVEEEPTNWNIKEGVYALTPKRDQISSRFLIHLLRSSVIRQRILGAADGSTVASVSMASLKRVLLPVPSLDEQDRVTTLLDKFEALTNDLSIGLPAELAARRKQYEHYRDKLLTFEEAVA